MRIESHKSKLATLLNYVGEWRKREGSRETVAQLIVEAHIALGNNNLPKMEFDTHGDTFTVWKNAADRIFRWLDDATKDTNFMPANFEDSILAAMPEDLRLAYLNDWLGRFGMKAKGIYGEQVEGCAVHHLKTLSKESAEATSAMADLLDGGTESELARADRELADQEEAARKARAYVQSLRKVRAVA